MLVNSGQLLNSSVGRTGTGTASASGSSLVINLQNRISSIITVTPAISAALTWSLSNDFNSLEFFIAFEMASFDAQTFPSDWIVSNLIGLWDGTDFTPLDLGKYLAHGIWDGTNWNVTLTGLFT